MYFLTHRLSPVVCIRYTAWLAANALILNCGFQLQNDIIDYIVCWQHIMLQGVAVVKTCTLYKRHCRLLFWQTFASRFVEYAAETTHNYLPSTHNQFHLRSYFALSLNSCSFSIVAPSRTDKTCLSNLKKNFYRS